jgi:hypothetical protein
MHRRMQRHLAKSRRTTLLGLTSFTRLHDVRASSCCNSRSRRAGRDRLLALALIVRRAAGQRTTLTNAYASDGVAV